MVWNDLNANGVQDWGEEPISGVRVSVTDASGQEVCVFITQSNGRYYCVGLDWGTYTVSAVAPPGYFFTTPNHVSVELAPANPSEEVNFGCREFYKFFVPAWFNLAP